jgi:ABC-type transport system involved in multi-copper enzyme maturation permease subunit
VTALVRSELRKVLTTNTWWLMVIGVVGFTAIALAANCWVGHLVLTGQAQDHGIEGVGQGLTGVASNVYTSGQFFGTLFVMLLGALMVTNEFHHQTATPTFLATPRRSRVIASKLATAAGFGMAFGLVTMLISVPVGAIFLGTEGVGSQLGEPSVLAALALNLLAYAVWAVFGVGIGTLLRNQIAAIVVCIVLKLVAEQLLSAIITLLAAWLKQEWIQNLVYALPSAASSAMTSAERVPGAPAWYTGAAILLGYGLVAAGVGSLLTRRRDIT